jgi:hypothetical protein
LKFKYLIMAFSMLIVLFLLITALLPLFVPEAAQVVNLRYVASPLLILMSVILVSFGIFFLINYRLFLLLEREDWPALAYYLEQKIFVKNRYNSWFVRLLASSYMVISDYPSVLKLENKAFLAKKSVVEKNVLIFGSSRVISGDYKGAAAFFKTHLDNGRLKKQDREWVTWFYGFSCLLDSAFDKAEHEFLSMAVSSCSVLITGISAYFLANNLAKNSLRRQDCLVAAEKGRSRVVGALKRYEEWKKEVKKTEAEIHVAVVRKYVDEAGIWLFSGKGTASHDKRQVTTGHKSGNIENSSHAAKHKVNDHEASYTIISDKRYIQEISKIKDFKDQSSANQDSANQGSKNQDSKDQG